MADYKEGQGVKTHRDNDFAVKLVDGASGTTATNKLSIVGEGDTIVADTNDYGIPMYVRKEDGTYCLPAADDACSLKVVVVDEVDETRVHSHKNHSAITASGGTDDHDGTAIPSAETVQILDVYLSSPGCIKWEIGEFDGTSTFDVRHVFWTQPANGNVCCKGLCIPTITGDAAKLIRIRATNEEDTDNDAYSSMCYKTLSA